MMLLREKGEGDEILQRKSKKLMLYRIRMYETCVTLFDASSAICSSVAPMKRKPLA